VRKTQGPGLTGRPSKSGAARRALTDTPPCPSRCPAGFDEGLLRRSYSTYASRKHRLVPTEYGPADGPFYQGMQGINTTNFKTAIFDCTAPKPQRVMTLRLQPCCWPSKTVKHNFAGRNLFTRRLCTWTPECPVVRTNDNRSSNCHRVGTPGTRESDRAEADVFVRPKIGQASSLVLRS